jgi:hypothetical protein
MTFFDTIPTERRVLLDDLLSPFVNNLKDHKEKDVLSFLEQAAALLENMEARIKIPKAITYSKAFLVSATLYSRKQEASYIGENSRLDLASRSVLHQVATV